MDEPLLTPDEVALLLKKSRLTIVRWLAKGTLKGMKLGNAWRIKSSDLDAFLAAQGQQPTKDEG